VSIDARRVGYKKYEVYINRGREATGLDPASWAQQAVAMGAGEIMITAIDREGTMEGYDLDLIKQVTSAVSVPVIAHGGAGTPEHFVEAIRDANAHAVAAASIFHFTDQSPIK